MSFAADLRRFSKKAGVSTKETVKAVKLELLSSVVLDTPVDTGRARGNWQVTENTPATGTTKRKSGSAVISDIRTHLDDDVTWMTNNLPYIEPLEEGSSTQAPAGMVRKNVARIKRIVKKAARQNR